MYEFSSETEFHEAVDRGLLQIQLAVDELDADTDADAELVGGILTLEFDNGSKIIINRQTPLREIWVAAKSGGFHFRFDGRVWLDTRSGEDLGALLSRVVSEQMGDRFVLKFSTEL